MSIVTVALRHSEYNSNSVFYVCFLQLRIVQGPMALQNTTSPTGAVVPGQSSTFFVEFDQVVSVDFDV